MTININIDKKTIKYILIGIVSAILVALILFTGIYCVKNKENPVQMTKDIFTSNETQIIGKWQEENGLRAYEFNEDGSYDSYMIANLAIPGSYEISGNKLELNNAVIYKISFKNDTMTMKLQEDSGTKTKDPEVYTFKRVKSINIKTATDIIQEVENSSKSEN